MKIPFKPCVCLVFLFCIMWQSTYSQLLYTKDYNSIKEKDPPPYNPDAVYISPDVEKWMKEQLSQEGIKRIVKMKTDLLGRAKSSSYGIDQEKVVKSKQKRLVVIADMHIRNQEIESIQGRYEYNPRMKSYEYYLNSKKMNAKEYDNYMKKYYEKFDKQKKGKRDLPIPGIVEGADDRIWIALMTAEEISKLVKNYKELVIEDYREPKPTALVSYILSTIQLSTLGHANGYNGKGIGVYVNEWNCLDPSYPIVNPSKYTQANNCYNRPFDPHHNIVVGVVQKASPQAHIYGFSGPLARPANPYTSFSYPLEIGTHSYCYFPVGNPNTYGTYDAMMDNYIYEHNMINFVSAGNVGTYGNCDPTSYHITSPSKALNAITVGAVHPAAPATNSYTNYSAWKNSEINNEKPELAMYTDIDLGNGYGFMNGTSASSPLAAGFTASLLDQHPFFKRHSALTKAVLLTGETIPIQNARYWDTDNFRSAQKIMNYSSVAWGTRSWYCEGTNSYCFNANNNTEIHITENNIQANRRYRIVISWLSEGNYVYQNKVIQQDLDLYVYQNGQFIASSASYDNPFEVVDFVTTSNAPLNITIRRYRNSGGKVLLGYHLRDNF